MAENPFDKSKEVPIDYSKVITDVGGSANIKLKESVERNVRANAEIEFKKSGRTLNSFDLPKAIEDTLSQSKLYQIEQVLKAKGMDSQQRSQALQMIKEILEP